jgi:hypothetical protein
MSIALNAHATVLTFDGFEDQADVPQSYGDRVVDFGTAYGSAGGPTPNVVVGYFASNGLPLSSWSDGYTPLTNALSSHEFDVPGYIQFTPDAGYDVILSNFQVAASNDESFPNSRISVTRGAGPVLFDTGSFTFDPGLAATYPATPLRSSSPLRINVQDFGNLGIDNVAFSQVPTIPEPETYALWLSGLGLLGLLKLRRSRRAESHGA